MISPVNKTTESSSFECKPNPCLNGMPCMRVNNEPMCFCTNGYEPPICSLPEQITQAVELDSTTQTMTIQTSNLTTSMPLAHECDPNPCLNDQKCLKLDNVPFCFCTAQFKPPFCS